LLDINAYDTRSNAYNIQHYELISQLRNKEFQIFLDHKYKKIIPTYMFGASQEGYGKKSQREVKELAWDGKEWRAEAYQSKDCNTITIITIPI
jgi:hypothetical protein